MWFDSTALRKNKNINYETVSNVFNFSHVTMFTFNKDKRTASVNLLDDKYKVFKDVVELQLEKVYR